MIHKCQSRIRIWYLFAFNMVIPQKLIHLDSRSRIWVAQKSSMVISQNLIDLNYFSRMFTAFHNLSIADILLIEVNQASLSTVLPPRFITQSLYTNANKAPFGRAFILTLARFYIAELLQQRQPGLVGQSFHYTYQVSLNRAFTPTSASPHRAEYSD